MNEGVLLLTRLQKSGVLDEVAERVRVERQGGRCGVDVAVYVMVFFAFGLGGGLRGLWTRVNEWATPLGLLAGRDALMSSSAVSRILHAVQEADVVRFARWLLFEASGAEELLRSSVALTTDGEGKPLRLFAYDPVRVAVRQRGLPEGEELPQAHRRARQLAAPGRTARKRGEVVFSVGVLEDLGTGTVLDVSLNPGNGDARNMFAQAVESVVATAKALGESILSTILLADGEFGTVPHLSRCVDAGLPIITRSSRYSLLGDPAVRQQLREGRWERVEDSSSGPVRYACEVGTVRLGPGANTRQDDGGRFDPVEVRLVVSRFAATKGDSGCGHQIDGDRYELFVSIGVPPSSFSAGDMVAVFYARCGQECSFQQHQRELGLQEVRSFNPAGQLFTIVVGLFVWNLRLVAGVQLSPPLPPRTKPSPRVVKTASPPALSTEPELIEFETVESPRTDSVGADTLGADRPLTAVDAVLEKVDWMKLLRHRGGWHWDSEQCGLRNPAGVLLTFVAVERIRHGSKLRFIGKANNGRQVQATVAVSAFLASAIAAARPTRTCAATQDSEPTAPVPTPMLATGFVAPSTAYVLPHAIGWPQLLRAAARKVVADLSVGTTIIVHHRPLRPARPRHPLVEPCRARRQHRRLTWSERLARHQSTGRTDIRIKTPSQQLIDWIRASPRDSRADRPGI